MPLFNSLLNILRFNRRNWKAVVLCILAATVFWFLNALNKTYTTNLNFPLAFEYDESNYVPVQPLPEQVRLNVTGNGWDLFKRSTGLNVRTLQIPLERPAEVRKIDGASLHRFFSQQVEGLEINFSVTDTLYLDIDVQEARWVKVALDSVYLNIQDGYTLASGVSIIPDSIFIEGPRRIVEDFQEPLLLRLRQKNIDESFRDDVEINLPASAAIEYEPREVAIYFDVERLVTITDSVQVTIENVPPTVAEVEDIRIPLTLSMPQNLAEEFTMDSVKAVLDLRDFVGGEAVLYPRIEGLPRYTRVVKVDSVRIRL